MAKTVCKQIEAALIKQKRKDLLGQLPWSAIMQECKKQEQRVTSGAGQFVIFILTKKPSAKTAPGAAGILGDTKKNSKITLKDFRVFLSGDAGVSAFEGSLAAGDFTIVRYTQDAGCPPNGHSAGAARP